MVSEEAYGRVKDWIQGRGAAGERVELTLKGFEGRVVAYRVGTRAGIQG